MCSKGGGSPPVPSAASTTFNSTTSPAPEVKPLYTDFLNRANTLSNTPFNPAMQGSVAPLNAQQTAAGGQLFDLGMHMGDFDPAKVQSIMSPYTESVVNATQNWFNNQNAIQGNDLISGAIRQGNAFGGDRAGVAQGVLAGQQQLAQAPVIAGLRQAGYTQALNEYNQLKQYGLQGAGAAMGWGGLEQQQAQRELDVAQQNAMMSSAYPFQTLNWYGSALGGIGPLLGQTAAGSNNPPEANSLSQAVGIGSSAIGLGSAALGAFNSPTAASSTTSAGSGAWRGGSIHRARGGLVDLPRGFAYGGDPSALPSDDSDQDKYRSSDSNREEEPAPSRSDQPSLPPQHRVTRPDFGFGQLNLGTRQLPQPVFPSTSGTTAQAQPNTTSQLLDFGTKAVGFAAKAAPLFALMSDPKTKTDVQRVGKTDDGEPLYGFRYRGDPKTYPKVVGPMAVPHWRGGGVRRYANGGGEDDDQLTMTDLGVLSPGGRELPASISGPGRGSPAGFNPQQADVMPNLARVRERFRPALENDPQLRARFDANTTAEVGERPEARNFYQALTLDRAAARGEALPYTLSRGPGTPDRYYPGSTTSATRTAGIGVSPSLWMGANPANYGTGNASYDPRTGREVGFAGGPQTGSIQTGSGTERSGVEGPDLPAVRRWGYAGPSRTAIGPGGPQGAGTAAQVDAEAGERTGATAGAAGPRGPGGGQGQGQRPGRAGEITNIPGLEKPAPTFGQRWASNPFTQFGAAMLAGKSPRFGANLGDAMQSTLKLQNQSRRDDILDAKPEHIVLPNGEQGFRIGGKIFNLGLGVPTSETRAAAAAARPYAVETETPGRFGTTNKSKKYYTDDPVTGERKPFESPVQPDSTGQQPRVIPEPDEKPATQPPVTPPAPQPPPTTAPQVRQTQAPAPGGTGTVAGDLQRPLEERLAAAESAAAGTTAPPTTATPAPTQQVQQVQPRQQAQPQQQPAAGPSKPYSHEDAWKNVIPAGTVTNPGALEATRNPAALEGLSPDDQRTIKAVAEYRSDPNKLFSGVKNSEKRAAIDGYAREYNPSYDPRNLPTRSKALLEYGVGGESAKSLKSNSMVLEHIGDAMTAVDNLGNSTIPVYNSITGTWQQQTGNEKYQAALAAVKTTVGAASTESAKTFRGVGSMSQREQELWHDIILGTKGDIVTASPVTMRAALKELTGLVAGRLNATANGYNQIMGPEYYRDGQSWMTPKAKETFGRASSITPEQNTSFPPSQYKATPSGAQGRQPQPGSSGGGGWQRDPSTGNYRGPDGRTYDSNGRPLQ